ncbi:MAG: CrcB family protein [Nocardioides sp.]|uniref:fluoride efflux transporter FluC n=1 Tax=Nocardioides sp. TaxID=35761 RepID=UPI0039E3D31D
MADRQPARIAKDLDIVAVIALGGALGSLGRWGLAEAIPHTPGDYAWATFVVNIVGGFALGFFMASTAEVLARTRLLRPFVGVGIIGGWTTFSTYMLDALHLLQADRMAMAIVGYLGGTLVAGLAAVWLGLTAGRLLPIRGGARR